MAALTKILMEQEKKKVVVLFRTCADLRLVERLCQAMIIYAFAVHAAQRKVGHNTLVMIQTGDSGSLAHAKTELRLEEFSVDEEDLERIEQTIQGHVARSKMLPALAAEASRAAPHSAGLEEVEEAVAGTDEESIKRGRSGSNLPPAKRSSHVQLCK